MTIYHVTKEQQLEQDKILSEVFETEDSTLLIEEYYCESVPWADPETQSRPGNQNGMYQYDWGDRYPKPFLGRKHTDETKSKMSTNNGRYWKGKSIPEEIRVKISKTKTGSSLSAETKSKMSKTRKGRKMSDEQKRKISEAAFARWAKVKNHQVHQEAIGNDVQPDN